jgi:hypothetical protein
MGYSDATGVGEELLEYVRAAQHRSRDICMVVLPTFDSEFEHIPGNFDFNQRATRNSWRLRATAEALRRALAQDKLQGTQRKEGKEKTRRVRVRVHFLDVFTASAALHFSAHLRHDPVHFNVRFYDWMVGAIHTAVTELCAGGHDDEQHEQVEERQLVPCPAAMTWDAAGKGKALWGLCDKSD